MIYRLGERVRNEESFGQFLNTQKKIPKKKSLVRIQKYNKKKLNKIFCQLFLTKHVLEKDYCLNTQLIYTHKCYIS